MNAAETRLRSVAETLDIGQTTARTRHVKRWLLWGVIAATCAVALAAGWVRSTRAPTAQYVTEPVTRGDLRVTVTATGNLQPTTQVEVGSELSGIVKTVKVDYDQRVNAGQVLARLDTTKLEAQVRQSEAALQSAQARLQQTRATVEEARNQLARLEQVHVASNGRVPSQQELDAARAALKRGEADEANAAGTVAQAAATLAANRTDLGKMVIRSPINGIVLKRAVEPGQTVAAAFQAPVLFTLAEDLARMELRVDVDEADVGRVKPGQEATFTVDAYPDRTFTARVTKVRYSSETVEGVVAYETVLDVDNSDLSLRPGMTATAELVVNRVTDAVLVPNAALRFVPSTAARQEAPSNSSGLVSRLLPRPPRFASTPRSNENESAEKTRQRVRVLRDGQPQEIAIHVGATDGNRTQVLDGGVQPGMAVIVDTSARSSS